MDACPAMVADEISELLVQLPSAKNAAETFSNFATHVQRMFVGLQHISLLLLSAEPSQAVADSTGATSGGSRHATQKGSCGRTGGKGSQGQADACTSSHQQQMAAGQKRQPRSLLDLNSKLCVHGTGWGLDWSNCCVYNIYPGRGPVVQPPPSWPLTCTATCYAAICVSDVVLTGDYATQGPHFLDWKSLADKGFISMAAVPMSVCNQPVAVLCLASTHANALSDMSLLKLLGGVLAPHCSLLEYTTRRSEMQRVVNDIITPIASQLAQQKHNQLARLGCTVEEAALGSTAVAGKGISVAVGGHERAVAGPSSRQGSNMLALRGSATASPSANGTNSPAPVSIGQKATKRKGMGVKRATPAGTDGTAAKAKGAGVEIADAGKQPNAGKDSLTHCITHKRFESVVVKSRYHDADSFGTPSDLDLDWSDFFFNLVSMAIVYVYFSKAAVAGESLVAILLCMGVAAFDIVLLIMRWLWFEQYINYGNMVMSVCQAYRILVLPVANTWMSWSLLNKMSVTPSWPIVALLGLILLACIVMGLQVRFFLHAPLQLASVLFAATSTPDICGAFFNNTSSLHCIGIISAVQLSLGLVLPSLLVYCLEGKSGRAFLPHMQAKRWLLHP